MRLSLPVWLITPLPQRCVFVSQSPLVADEPKLSSLRTTARPETVVPVTRIPFQVPEKTKPLALPSMSSQLSQSYSHYISGPLQPSTLRLVKSHAPAQDCQTPRLLTLNRSQKAPAWFIPKQTSAESIESEGNSRVACHKPLPGLGLGDRFHQPISMD